MKIVTLARIPNIYSHSGGRSGLSLQTSGLKGTAMPAPNCYKPHMLCISKPLPFQLRCPSPPRRHA